MIEGISPTNSRYGDGSGDGFPCCLSDTLMQTLSPHRLELTVRRENGNGAKFAWLVDLCHHVFTVFFPWTILIGLVTSNCLGLGSTGYN